MNILITILLILAGLIVVILVIAALSKTEYSIQREIIINKPVQQVFDFIKYLKNQQYYNKWVMADPDVKRNYTGTDGTAGFIATWDSENKQVGKGEQEIKKIKEGERIYWEIRFIKPFEGKAGSYMITESVSANETRIIWVFEGMRSYMLKVMHLILNLKKVLGNDLQTSLTNLKAVLERTGNEEYIDIE